MVFFYHKGHVFIIWCCTVLKNWTLFDDQWCSMGLELRLNWSQCSRLASRELWAPSLTCFKVNSKRPQAFLPPAVGGSLGANKE